MYKQYQYLFTDHFFETTPNYLMKVDDDTFVNLPKLYHLLTENKLYKNLKHLLMGSCFCGTPAVLKVSNVCLKSYHLHVKISKDMCFS